MFVNVRTELTDLGTSVTGNLLTVHYSYLNMEITFLFDILYIFHAIDKKIITPTINAIENQNKKLCINCNPNRNAHYLTKNDIQEAMPPLMR